MTDLQLPSAAHFQPDIEAFADLQFRHHIAQVFFQHVDVSHIGDPLGKRQAIGVDADAARDRIKMKSARADIAAAPPDDMSLATYALTDMQLTRIFAQSVDHVDSICNAR